MSYFYWHCHECGRHFKSLKGGGRGVVCFCGCVMGVNEITKKEYDLWREEDIEKCKAT